MTAKAPGSSRLRHEKRGASLAYRDLDVYRVGGTSERQDTFANYPSRWLSTLGVVNGHTKKKEIRLLHGLEGLLERGTMLLILGRPGSGCTTTLRTLAGQSQGTNISQSSKINYQGIIRNISTKF